MPDIPDHDMSCCNLRVVCALVGVRPGTEVLPQAAHLGVTPPAAQSFCAEGVQEDDIKRAGWVAEMLRGVI
jgi:hypothetical protein